MTARTNQFTLNIEEHAMPATRPTAAVLVATMVTIAAPSALAQDRPLRYDTEAGTVNGIPVSQGRFNAALRYYAEWSISPALFDRELTGEIDLNDDAWQPGNDLSAVLASHDDAMSRLIEATRLDRCDFGVTYEQGVHALLPHLGTLRATARLLLADSRRLRAEGEFDAAAARIAAALRLARQSTGDGVLISSLVGTAVASAASAEGHRLIAQTPISRRAAAEMIEAIDTVLGEDPARMRASLASEQTVFVAWLRAEFDPHAIAADPDLIRSYLREIGWPEDTYQGQFSENPEAWKLALAQLDLAYDEQRRALDGRDPSVELRAFNQKLELGEYGPLAPILMPAIAKAVRSVEQMETTTLELRDALVLML